MKKGFTLIELLAVILILGIIALIAIPTVNNIISEARYGAFKSGNENIIKSIEEQCQTDLIKGKNPTLTYIFDDNNVNLDIDVKGSIPSDGYIFLTNNCNVTDYYLSDGKNIYSNGEDVRDDYMLKAPLEEKTSIFKTMYPDYYDNIISVSIINDTNIPESAIEIKDPSVSEKGKIKSWIIQNGEFYDLYIASNKIIYANYDSSYLFGNLRKNENFDLTNFSVNFAENLSNVFRFNSKLKNLDVSNWNISNATNISHLFYSCYSLLNLDISNWDTRNVTIMNNLFANCYVVSSLDVSKWNTDNLLDMSSLFNDCRLVEFLDLSNWNTSKVTVMSLLFGANDNVDIPMKLSIIKGIESLDLSSAKDINRMFYNCRNIKNLDLSNWNIENVTTIEMMFYSCTSLENVNISNWNTKIVEKMNKLFYQCYSLKSINLSGWKFDSISNIEQMFQDNNNLNDITINTTSYNILTDQIPDRTSSEPGIITIVGDKTDIDTSLLNSKNWNVV